MIKIENLSIDIGNRTLKSKQELTYFPGNLHFIKGESGAGKTSYLYVLGMVSSKHGYDYYYQNKLINSRKQKEIIRKNDIGFLYQNMSIEKEISLFDNLKLFSQLNGRKLKKKQAELLLRKVRLNIDLSRKTGSLSGGELQRFCLACILAKKPKIIIADEPTSALDSTNASLVMHILWELAKTEQKIVIVSTHTNKYDEMADCIDYIESDCLERISLNLQTKDEDDSFPSDKKINQSFYKDLIWARIKGTWKKQCLPIILSIMVLSLSSFLSSFVIVIQNEYDVLLDQSSSVELFLIPSSDLWLNEEEMKKIEQLKYVNDIYPIIEIPNQQVIIDGQTLDSISVYPMKTETKQIFVSSDLREYIGEYCLYHGEELLIKDVITMQQISLYGANAKSIFVPVELIDSTNGNFYGRYIIDFDFVLELDYLKSEIAELDLDYDLINPQYLHETMIFSFYSQRNVLYYAATILKFISIIMFIFINYQNNHLKRKAYTVYQSNGLLRKEIVNLEIREYLIKLLIQATLMLCLCSLWINLGNHYLFSNNVLLTLNAKDVLEIIQLIMISDSLPNFIFLIISLNFSIEHELRAFQ